MKLIAAWCLLLTAQLEIFADNCLLLEIKKAAAREGVNAFLLGNDDLIFSDKLYPIFLLNVQNQAQVSQIVYPGDGLIGSTLLYLGDKRVLILPKSFEHEPVGEKWPETCLKKEATKIGGRLKFLLHNNRMFPTLVDPLVEKAPGVMIALIRLIAERVRAEEQVVSMDINDMDVVNEVGDDVTITYYLVRDPALFQKYDMSKMVYQDLVIWIVPKSEETPAVKSLLELFTTTILLLTLATLVVCAVVFHVHTRAEFSQCVMYLLGPLVGVATYWRFPPPLKILTALYLLFCLSVSSLLQGEILNSFMQLEPAWEISTVQEMLDHGLTPILSKLQYRYVNTSNHPLAKSIIGNCTVSSENVTRNLIRVAYEKKHATFMGERLLKTYGARHLVRVLHETVGLRNIEASYALRKGHPFTPIVNKFVTIAMEHGFVEKWLKDIGRSDRNVFQVQSEGSITFQQFLLSMVLWGVGVGLATIAFVFEFVMGNQLLRSCRRP